MKQENLDPEVTKAIFTFYKNIKRLRESNGLTTKQMAEIIDISEKRLLMAEAFMGIGHFYDFHLKNICVYFNVSADELFTENEN